VRLATTERIFNRQTNETTEHTEWHSITLWRGLAEVADKYIHKGSQLYIEGRLRNREWEKDGVKQTGVEIVADDMKLLGRRQEGSQPQPAYQPSQAQGYQQAPQPQSYQQSAQSHYQQSQPASPVMPADDPDDMPF
jgi:single-strand DNA-binding protein